MYEAMVKEAYDNIVGFEKEAGVRYNRFMKNRADASALRRHEAYDRDVLGVSQADARARAKADLRNKKRDDRAKNYADYVSAISQQNDASISEYAKRMANKSLAASRDLARKNQERDDRAESMKERGALYNEMNRNRIDANTRNTAILNAMEDRRYENRAARRAIGQMGSGHSAGRADLRAKQRAHRLDLAEQRQAEKAAAYYDEAQFAKQAAENDYLEACAYEEAALAILDELGYLD